MKAVVFHDVGKIQVDNVPEPALEEPTDAIVRLTATAICGTDLHMVRGTMPGMKPGTILGHEGVGVVEEVGAKVRNLNPGDRVVIPSTIACGTCAYCRAGYYAQCDDANPNGQRAGTSFFGGPQTTGAFNGLQAEYARIPFANVGLVKLPDEVTDDQAIMLSDIFPTGYFGADLAEVTPGDIVAVWGCGPVGQFAIASAYLIGASRVIAVDCLEDRLQMAAAQGAEVIDFNREDPVEAILDLTGGIGTDRAIDAVGVDAEAPGRDDGEGRRELWQPGNAPTKALEWAIDGLAKAGTLSIIGVYPPNVEAFPVGQAMNRNLTINMGNCNHLKYIPDLVRSVRSGRLDPEAVMTNKEPLTRVMDAYEAFDRRQPGWIKVELTL